MTTRAPSPAKPSAIARPRLDAPPVTITTRPLSPRSIEPCKHGSPYFLSFAGPFPLSARNMGKVSILRKPCGHGDGKHPYPLGRRPGAEVGERRHRYREAVAASDHAGGRDEPARPDEEDGHGERGCHPRGSPKSVRAVGQSPAQS